VSQVQLGVWDGHCDPDLSMSLWRAVQEMANEIAHVAQLCAYDVEGLSKGHGTSGNGRLPDTPAFLRKGDAGRGAKKPNRKAGTARRGGKEAHVKSRFKFRKGQALFDGKDLELPSDAPVAVLKKLVGCFGRVVPYTDFDKHYSSATPGALPVNVTKIRNAFLKHEVPCEIKSKTSVGYFIRETVLPIKRKKRVRKRS
jgi:hypothetical protein